MPPGQKSFKTGMCLQRAFNWSPTLNYYTAEKLDGKTKDRVGTENFKKVSIEIRKLYYKTKSDFVLNSPR